MRATQQILATCVAVTAAGLIGVANTGETFALWSDSAPIPGSSITAGGGELEVGGTLPPFENALPGEQAHYAFAVHNASSVELVVTTRLEVAVEHFDIRALITDADADCASFDLDVLPALTTAAGSIGTVMPSGEELQLCAVITALPEVEPLDTAEFILVLEGIQAL